MQNLFLTLSEIKEARPPCSLDLVRKLSAITWDFVADEEIDAATETILFISATVIVCKFDMHGETRTEYKKYFHAMKDNILNSRLLEKSDNFLRYFSKVQQLIDDL